MPTDQEQPIEIAIDSQLGIYNAVQATSLPKGGYLLKKNAYMSKIGSNCKRPGSAPVTTNALAAIIPYITEYQFPNSVAAPTAPTLSIPAGASTLPAATYFVRSTYSTDNGETAASVESSIVIALGQIMRVVVAAIPYHANSINHYISTTTNTETLRFNTTLTTFDISAPLPVAGKVYPTVNTTAFTSELLASSGTSLYSFYNSDLRSALMTNPLNKSDIYTLGFTDLSLVSILFITDGGAVKKYDGSAVANITPAPDDVAPAPANYLATLNTLKPIYCWTFKGFMFLSIGDSSAWHSKLGRFDYFPITFTTQYVRNNDYITGCGVPFGDVCMIPMRRTWGVTTYNSSVSTLMIGNNFLNTVNGNIAPRAIQKITYPDGTQTIAYLSDDGVYEIWDTGYVDSSNSGTRNYATKPLMKDKVDFSSYGFTEAEKIAANAYFDSITNMYILNIKRGAINYSFVYDCRNREWTGLWENIKAESSIRFKNVLYYAGSTRLLHKYDDTLATDYDDLARTTGTIVIWDCYTDLIALEDTGYQSMLDYLVFFVKNFVTPSSMDFTVITFNSTEEYLNAVRSQYMTWGITNWGEAVWANLDFSTQVGAPTRRVVKKRSFYFQIRMRNAKNELFELYKMKIIGRKSGN